MRIQSTYNKFIQREIAKANVRFLSPEVSLRIDTKIADAFNKASQKAKRKQIISAIAIANRIFNKMKR